MVPAVVLPLVGVALDDVVLLHTSLVALLSADGATNDPDVSVAFPTKRQVKWLLTSDGSCLKSSLSMLF